MFENDTLNNVFWNYQQIFIKITTDIKCFIKKVTLQTMDFNRRLDSKRLLKSGNFQYKPPFRRQRSFSTESQMLHAQNFPKMIV